MSAILKLEEVYRTEGVPEYTFVKPPNYNEILVDIRTAGKPVIVEGQSGTGKTTTVRKILERLGEGISYRYLTARRAEDVSAITDIAAGKSKGAFIIDDFHRLDNQLQSSLANLVKSSAELWDPERYPKIVIVGINRVGSELINLVHDIAKRCGIHRISPADPSTTAELIAKGEQLLNVRIRNKDGIFVESKGDYWLTQLFCHTICLNNDVLESVSDQKELTFSISELRQKVIQRLEHNYLEPIKQFCRGKRFRATNDPYLKLLRCVGEQDSSIVDVTELANANEAVRGSINNIKEKRLSILIESKPICETYFYYNPETKNFAIEDPALFYYLKHLDWERLKRDCGFRSQENSFQYDFALSFAGEHRLLARQIAEQLEILDCAVFFDELFENNFLGTAWTKQFQQIFKEQARFVVCLLDEHYSRKIWPIFEKECFVPRLNDGAIIPIYLDETVFLGIPREIAGITFKYVEDEPDLLNRAIDEIVFRLGIKLERS